MAGLTAIPGGVYPPLPTFFDRYGDVDVESLRRHVMWLAEFPLAGVLALGSNGEAMLLDDHERVQVITTVRAALAEAATQSTTVGGWRLLAGCADLSTRGTIQRCQAAADAGADAAVVLPPFAFPSQMTPVALRDHYFAVADASPLPIIIYNMPANAANIDLSAEQIVALAEHANIIGVKDSSGNIAKLARIAATTKPHFAVLAGSGSYLLPALSIGGTGAIAAVANVVPNHTAAIYHLWQGRFAAGSFIAIQQRETHARLLQAAIIPLNQLVTATYGVAGLKAALEIARGYGGEPRAPLLSLDTAGRTAIHSAYSTLMNIDPAAL
jgi:4-hydroxy-2-oxoglutarate aldolase